MRIRGVFLFLGLGLSCQASADNVWSRFTVPASGNPESIGSYANGCLRGSALLIGELSQIRGGPFVSGHDSHQIGLDVDILFHTHPEQRMRSLSVAERDQFKPPSMLKANGRLDLSRFGKEQILKLKLASLDPKVERIFVNPVIKAHLCTHLAPEDRDWLRKIRPWRGHHAHFHVRIGCPLDSKECIPQGPVPQGDGCRDLIAKFNQKSGSEALPSLHGPIARIPPIDSNPDFLDSPEPVFKSGLLFSCLKVMEET
jgi:murein endopeptidase